MIDTPGYTEYAIELKHRQTDEGVEYRWRREDGKWVSPTYSTAEAAQWCHSTANPHRIPFLTDDEWKAYHPFPHPDPKLTVKILGPNK